MFERENAVGMILLVLCGVVAIVLGYAIVTGERFRFTGPSWVGTALFLFFIGAAIYSFVRQPGRRWPWQRGSKDDEGDGPI